MYGCRVKERVREVLQEASDPVSIDYVRYHANTTWAIAKASLLELLIEGKIVGLKTSKSWVFWVEKKGDDLKGS